jgi:hypothetical protein
LVLIGNSPLKPPIPLLRVRKKSTTASPRRILTPASSYVTAFVMLVRVSSRVLFVETAPKAKTQAG